MSMFWCCIDLDIQIAIYSRVPTTLPRELGISTGIGISIGIST